ncbi:MAG TPA: carboxypeptidase-like regulatory domain-containing protein [Polyangiaceae bacterium]|nr:carboxypeptidase-like regulatory domain-containing protein [Polyangiaceae bacterium]
MRLAAVYAALSYWLTPCSAAAETQLRVTGSLTIEASASQLPAGSELSARLLDDAGHGVAGRQLQIKPLNASGPLIARECQSRTASLPPTANGAYVARSNGAGALCVRFEGTPQHAEFELSVADSDGLYAPTTRNVIADSATRSVQMAFAPAPTVLALERESQTVTLATRPLPALSAGEAVELLSVSLLMKREGQAAQSLAVATVEIGNNAEFRVPSRLLGKPGPLELSAEFAGSSTTRAARALARATATALVELSLAEPIVASHPERGVRLRVRARSVAGAVQTGSVEARSGDSELGSARVVDGVAELFVQLDESAAKSRPIELRYASDSPWWLAGPELAVSIPVLPPSPWRRIAWIAAVVLLGSWLLLGWQRPRRLERRATSLAPAHAVRVPVDLIEVGDLRSGWRGRVLDAHDGNPIADALVLMRLPAFDESGVLRSARTDDQGAFALEGPRPAGPGAALEVRAPLHTPLAAPMPPPGTLVLSLTSRRRTLLGRFVDWAFRDGGWERHGEATPGEVARRTDRQEVATWASALDEAAFGPEPLSEAKEQAVIAREPPHSRKQ